MANSTTANLLAGPKGHETALLVSDDSPAGAHVEITVPGNENLHGVDLFTNQIVDRLDQEHRTFEVTLRRDFQARLYHLQRSDSTK